MLAGRGQILVILQGNSSSIAQGINEIWSGQTDLQPISFKSDRLLGRISHTDVKSCAISAPLLGFIAPSAKNRLSLATFHFGLAMTSPSGVFLIASRSRLFFSRHHQLTVHQAGHRVHDARCEIEFNPADQHYCF